MLKCYKFYLLSCNSTRNLVSCLHLQPSKYGYLKAIHLYQSKLSQDQQAYLWFTVQQTATEDGVEEHLMSSDDVIQISGFLNLVQQLIPWTLQHLHSPTSNWSTLLTTDNPTPAQPPPPPPPSKLCLQQTLQHQHGPASNWSILLTTDIPTSAQPHIKHWSTLLTTDIPTSAQPPPPPSNQTLINFAYNRHSNTCTASPPSPKSNTDQLCLQQTFQNLHSPTSNIHQLCLQKISGERKHTQTQTEQRRYLPTID